MYARRSGQDYRMYYWSDKERNWTSRGVAASGCFWKVLSRKLGKVRRCSSESCWLSTPPLNDGVVAPWSPKCDGVLQELGSRKALGEGISDHVVGRDVYELDVAVAYELMHTVGPNVDVFGTSMMHRVVCKSDSALIVLVDGHCCVASWFAKVLGELLEEHRVVAGEGQGIVLSFAG